MDEFYSQPTIVKDNSRLPSLPASDPESIAQNKFSGFYNVGAREYWKYSEINLHKLTDKEKCPHFWMQEGIEARCKRCYVGYFGPGIRAYNGKLFFNNIEAVL